MENLKIVRQTLLKLRPLQSSVLAPNELVALPEKREIQLTSWEDIGRGHLKVVLAEVFSGSNTWYVFAEHAQIIRDGKVAYPKPMPKEVKLAVPYKSQLDNQENPTGSCNVTSIAMVLEFYGVKKRTGAGQLEDELYRELERRGWSRHQPQDLQAIANEYGKPGVKDEFTTAASLDEIRAHLAAGNPVVVHGYFTAFGHIVVLVGYNSNGFLVHDPYGEWTPGGYIRNWDKPDAGKYIEYSNSLICDTCLPDGGAWAHFFKKEG